MKFWTLMLIFALSVSAKPGKNWKEELFSQNVNPNYILDWWKRVSFSVRVSDYIDDRDSDSQYFVGHVGENVSLNCQEEVYFKGTDRIWSRQLLNGTFENLFFGNKKITADPRFGISRDGNLTIADLSPGYFGVYVCTPPCHSLTSCENIFHGVLGFIPPKVSTAKSMIVAPEVDEVTLMCKATGFPQPDVIWKRNDEGKEMFEGQIIDERVWISSNINIPVKIQDTQPYYTCNADYIEDLYPEYLSGSYWNLGEFPLMGVIGTFYYGQILSAKPAKNQKEDRFPFPWLPSFRKDKRTGVHAYKYGSKNVSFSCQFDDIADDVRLSRQELPNGTLKSWYFHGEKITASSKYRISKDGNLTITEVFSSDSGRYECVIRYDQESSKVDHILYVEDLTELSTMIVEEEDGSITLGCKVAGKWLTAGQPEIKWHKFSSKQKAIDVLNDEEIFFDAGETFSQELTISTITIDNYNKEAYGLYECVANNHAGSDKARILVEAQSQSSSSEATTAATTTKYHECNDLSSITAILIPVLVFFILMFIILIVFILFLVLRQKRKTSENSVEMKEVRSNEMEEPQDNSCERKLDTFARNYWAKATWPLPHRMKELRGSTPNLNIVNSTDTITKYAPSEC